MFHQYIMIYIILIHHIKKKYYNIKYNNFY